MYIMQNFLIKTIKNYARIVKFNKNPPNLLLYVQKKEVKTRIGMICEKSCQFKFYISTKEYYSTVTDFAKLRG